MDQNYAEYVTARLNQYDVNKRSIIEARRLAEENFAPIAVCEGLAAVEKALMNRMLFDIRLAATRILDERE